MLALNAIVLEAANTNLPQMRETLWTDLQSNRQDKTTGSRSL